MHAPLSPGTGEGLRSQAQGEGAAAAERDELRTQEKPLWIAQSRGA